jgi:hypothetical protein
MFFDGILKTIRDGKFYSYRLLKNFKDLNLFLESQTQYRKKFEICFVPNMNIFAILRIVKIGLGTRKRGFFFCFLTKACFLIIIIISDDNEIIPVS